MDMHPGAYNHLLADPQQTERFIRGGGRGPSIRVTLLAFAAVMVMLLGVALVVPPMPQTVASNPAAAAP